MNESQFRQLETELRREVDLAIARANGGSKGWRVTQVVVMISSLVLTLIIVPWGVWVTKTIQDVRITQAETKSWQAIGPRFTATDGENLRLRVLSEVQDRVDRKLENIGNKLDKLADALQEHMQNGKDTK